MFREDYQELIVQANRLINTMPKILTDLQVLRSKPTTHAVALQVSIQPFSKVLVLASIVTVDKGIAPLTAAPNRTGRFPFIRLFSVWSLVIDTLCAIFCMSHIVAMSMKNTLVI